MHRQRHIWKIFIFDLFIIEFGPVGIFFIVYHFTDFPRAALGLGISTLVAIILSRLINKRVPWFAIFSGSATILTSFVTFLYTAPSILIIKDSVYYGLFALVLGWSAYRKLHLFKAFFGHIFAITDRGWVILELRWLVFFILVTMSNEYVRVFLGPDEWVLYKFGVVGAFLIFGLYQFRVSSRYRLPEADKIGLRTLPGTTIH